MKEELKSFYDYVVRKPAYWLPILIFSMAAFGFDICNRTVSIDDLRNGIYLDSFTRWGNNFLLLLLGLTDYSPFIEKFFALLNFILSGTLLCFLLSRYEQNKRVFGYSFLTCVLVTFPLITEHWSYNVTIFSSSLGLLMSLLAILVIQANNSKINRSIYAGLLMVIPISSYEASIFSYIAIFCILVFYEYVICEKSKISIRKWLSLCVTYTIPLLIALIIRLIVYGCLVIIIGVKNPNAGNSIIYWFQGDIIHNLVNMIGGNAFMYVINGLVYLPITEFVISAIVFWGIIIVLSIKRHSFSPLLLGLIVFVALFALSLLQCYPLMYRAAQSISIFVAFVVYLVYRYTVIANKKYLQVVCVVFFSLLCFRQSAFINRVQSLNNQRSDNEIATIRDVGRRLVSDYDNKPVVFVSQYYSGEWIEKRNHVDSNSWNGKLFFAICKPFDDLFAGRDYSRIVRDNIGTFVWNPETAKDMLAYCGYDIDVVQYPSPLIGEAIEISKQMELKPYQIIDNGSYIIVQLGGKKYFANSFE